MGKGRNMGTHSLQGRRGARAGGENVRLMSACIAVPPQLMYRKGWALLGYLAVEPEHRHSRLARTMLLWPQLGEMQALTNLRQVLCNLSRYCGEVLGPGVLCVERNGVALRRKGQSIFDIDRLATEPEEALAVLGGRCVFLAGMDGVAGVDFRTWLEGARLALTDRRLAAELQLVRLHADDRRQHPQLVLLGDGLAIEPAGDRLRGHRRAVVAGIEALLDHRRTGLDAPRLERLAQPLRECRLLLVHGQGR